MVYKEYEREKTVASHEGCFAPRNPFRASRRGIVETNCQQALRTPKHVAEISVFTIVNGRQAVCLLPFGECGRGDYSFSEEKKASFTPSTLRSSRDRPLLFGIGITWPKGDMKRHFRIGTCQSSSSEGISPALTYPCLKEGGRQKGEESEKMEVFVYEVHDVSQNLRKGCKIGV